MTAGSESHDRIEFEDNFSRQAEIYARHRPRYPAELYDWLASLTRNHDTAWDCGSGNGQAAVMLAEHFDRVIATDASADQIVHAARHPRVEYRVALAEHSELPDASIDLITVATAVHWFNLDLFFTEARRTLRPDGVIAVWTLYHSIITSEIDPILLHFNVVTLGEYWSDRIYHPRHHYRQLPFPFEEIRNPPFEAKAEWGLDDLLGFLASWSAVQKYREVNGADPIDLIRDDLKRAWGDGAERRIVRWPLYMRVGRSS